MKPAYRITGSALQGFLKRLARDEKPPKRRGLPIGTSARSREPARQEAGK